MVYDFRFKYFGNIFVIFYFFLIFLFLLIEKVLLYIYFYVFCLLFSDIMLYYFIFILIYGVLFLNFFNVVLGSSFNSDLLIGVYLVLVFVSWYNFYLVYVDLLVNLEKVK